MLKGLFHMEYWLLVLDLNAMFPQWNICPLLANMRTSYSKYFNSPLYIVADLNTVNVT